MREQLRIWMDAAMRIALRGNLDVTDSATGDALRKVRLGNVLRTMNLPSQRCVVATGDSFPEGGGRMLQSLMAGDISFEECSQIRLLPCVPVGRTSS